MVNKYTIAGDQAPYITIIIATKGRTKGLRRLFSSLTQLQDLKDVGPEIIVVNNADDGAAEQTVTALVEEFRNPLGTIRCIREKNGISPRPKCRGQNFAIREAQGSILAFVDDDVEVTPEWIKAVQDFFLRHSYDAMQGAIFVPPAFQENREFLKVWNRYRTIPYINYGPGMTEVHTLTGPNMAIRREVFDRVGLFDERLGPGRSGMSEDVEFAQRILKGNGRIGYEPKAAVYHEADWERLNDAFFRKWHEQQGRSRLLYKNSMVFTILPNLGRSLISYKWYSLFFNERKKYRALGRYYHYMAMLKEKFRVNHLSGSEVSIKFGRSLDR